MEPATVADTTHKHHWIIEEPHGGRSMGFCKYCDAHRDFQNWLPETDFVTREEASWKAAS